MERFAVALLVGALAGLHAATWGMYKDTLHEGFTWRKYARSIVVGAAAGILVRQTMGLPPTGAAAVVLLFALAYVVERAAVEFYKTFVRREDQSKYFIPMQFAVFGRVVHDPRARAAAGMAAFGLVALVIAGILAFAPADGGPVRVATAAVLGSIGGWISAFGGAWKDAPKEGFQPFKFLRSPAISALYGLLLGILTTESLVIAFGSLGLTIATIETYKTFVKAREPRGKFAGMPVRFPEMVAFRRPFALVFLMLWAWILVTFGMALTSASGGLMASDGQALRP